MIRPLAVELFAGLHGWGAGCLAAGFRVVGFDIVDMAREIGEPKPEGDLQLVIQDVRTLHGSQFKDASLIIASPPCTEFSWMAMPWSRAKQVGRALRGQDEFPDNYKGSRTIPELTALFDACFRIQREASEAAGRHIPMVVENVKGAQPWVGRARWNFGSFYLYGDVPALMPMTKKRAVMKEGVTHRSNGATNFHGHETGVKAGDRMGPDGKWTTSFEQAAIKNGGGSWFNIGSPGQKELARNPVHEAIKGEGDSWFGGNKRGHGRDTSSKSAARKAASARIARIPFALASYIAQVYYPRQP